MQREFVKYILVSEMIMHSTKTSILTLTLIEGHVKLGEVSDHSIYHWIDRQVLLSLNERELDGYIWPKDPKV